MRDFVQCHLNDDTTELLLSAHRYGNINMASAVEQIEARRRLREKLPTWHANADLVMAGRVPAEQCSSELTARYKRSIVDGKSLCDLTGGMGVDFWHLSEGMNRAIYTERDAHLCEVARHNFEVLADERYPVPEVRQGDGRELPIPQVDVLYLDPARRANDGSRVYAVEECEPNVIAWQDALLEHCNTLLVKLSPMADLKDVVRKMKRVTDLYVVGVRNECKEVLVKASGIAVPWDEKKVRVHCVDFLPTGRVDYSFPLNDSATTPVSECVGHYLYEPDVTLMKAFAFASLCRRFDVAQLAADTHLMTSNCYVGDFPGRKFVVEECIPFASKTLKRLKAVIPQANISVRNFPLTADELRRRTGIRDGGEVYLFGAKVSGSGDMLLRCRKKT